MLFFSSSFLLDLAFVGPLIADFVLLCSVLLFFSCMLFTYELLEFFLFPSVSCSVLTSSQSVFGSDDLMAFYANSLLIHVVDSLFFSLLFSSSCRINAVCNFYMLCKLCSMGDCVCE